MSVIGKKLKSGIFWQYTQTAFVTGFNFIVGVIFARLLDPSDFGVFAAVTAITNLSLFQVNFAWPAAILRSKEIDEPFLSTIFWIMQASAAVVTLLIFSCAQFLSDFYEDPRFSFLIMLMCAQFFIVPFNTINGSILRWNMRYDIVSRISMVVVFVSSCCGIFLAYTGFGVYSLAVSGLLASILLTVIMAVYAPWIPKFIFSWAHVKSHFDFSWRLHVNNTLNLLSNRIDNMLLGKVMDIKSLGIYVKAFSLGRMPVDLLGTNLYQMFFTALSRLRDDRTSSLLMYQKMIAALTFAIYLPLLLLFLVGEGFVVNLYGAKWIAAVNPMKIMLIGSFFTVICMTSGAFIDAQNLVKEEVKVQIFKVGFTILAVIIGANWGLSGVATGIAIRGIITLVLLKRILYRGIQLKWVDLWHPVWPSLASVIAGFSFARIFLLFLESATRETSLIYMFMVCLSAVAGYCSTWLFLAIRLKNHHELETLLSTLKTTLLKLPLLKKIKFKSYN